MSQSVFRERERERDKVKVSIDDVADLTGRKTQKKKEKIKQRALYLLCPCPPLGRNTYTRGFAKGGEGVERLFFFSLGRYVGMVEKNRWTKF